MATPFCTDCPDREACGQGLDCIDVRAANPQRAGTVGDVIDARVAIYGDPTETFGRIAEVWTGILGHTVNPVEVPLMLMGMKLVRTQVTPDYSDNSDDIEGYLDIFRQLVGEDMVHARLTSEYLEKKAAR